MHILLALLRARNKEFLHDRATLAWNLLFPFLMIIGLGVVFSGGGAPLVKVGWLDQGRGELAEEDAATARAWLSVLPLWQDPSLQRVRFAADPGERARALEQVRRHQLDLLLAPGRYWVNDENPKGRMLERALKGDARGHREEWQRIPLHGEPIRYVDWFLPGALGMNLLFSCLFGVGFVLVRYRKARILRRLYATPIQRWQFLTAQVLSRLWLVLLMNAVLYVGCDLLIDFHRVGSLWLLSLVLSLGACCLISLGLLICARTASQELAGGLLNFGTWPMMLLSEVWFSLEGAHPAVSYFSQILPLTHIVSAARAVMIDGASLTQIAPQLGLLTALTLVFLTLGVLLFRWD